MSELQRGDHVVRVAYYNGGEKREEIYLTVRQAAGYYRCAACKAYINRGDLHASGWGMHYCLHCVQPERSTPDG